MLSKTSCQFIREKTGEEPGILRCRLLVGLLIGLLVGCAGTPQEIVTPPVVEIVVATPTLLPAVPTSPPLPTTTPNPNPTTTDFPATLTPLPTETPSPTPIPTVTLIPTAQPIAGISLELVAAEFDSPVYLTHAFDKRLFVVEQSGIIQIIDEDGVKLPNPFLDISERVNDVATEQGLLSLAFHPDYVNNGRFFVDYTDSEGDTVVAEFQVSDDPDLADNESEKIILQVEQPHSNHNGGLVLFGPDKQLYIGLGDGGSQRDPDGNGQNAGTLLGTILRINVDLGDPYAVPADNPFVGTDEARNEIWAYGFRNPWRFSFDALTGDLFSTDVGQSSFEEVNFQPAASTGGENYGWVIMEGSHCHDSDDCDRTGLVIPITDYGRDEGCSVTGGNIYRGSRFPELFGHYFFGDFCQGTIWSLREDAGSWLKQQVWKSEINISSFGEGVDGELYVLDRGGDVYHIMAE